MPQWQVTMYLLGVILRRLKVKIYVVKIVK